MSDDVTGDYLSYFSGGVPPLAFFMMRSEDVLGLSSEQLASDGLNFTCELCMIGIAAYFEAFCKDQFAAIVNIAPQTLMRFTAARDFKVPVKSLLHTLPDLSHRLGFVIAEESDFGTAKSINSLFADLLNITPFAKAEMIRYGGFLSDRNLLVHHGGVFTLKYASQKFTSSEIKEMTNWDSLTVGHKDIERWAKFLRGIAVKTAKASSKALMQFATDINSPFDAETSAAVKALEQE